MLGLGERLTQMHDDYFRLRETIGALPTRSELRDIGDHLAERWRIVWTGLSITERFISSPIARAGRGARAPADRSLS
jgi:hypothetical protein